MKHQRVLNGLLVTLCLLGVALLAYPTAAASTGLKDAWQQALNAGAYSFEAEVKQTLVPRPIPSMIGQHDERVKMQLEGAVTLPDQARLRLQLEGTGLNTTSVELVQEGAETYLLRGDERLPVENPLGMAAPTADTLSYLAAAENVHACENVGLAPAGLQTCYAYDIDGARFAKQVRDQMWAQLKRDKAYLPPGVELSPPALLQRMSGQGWLWVDANGLPRRQVLDLDLPRASEAYDVRVHLVVDLTFDRKVAGEREAAGPMRSSGAKGLTPAGRRVDLAPADFLPFLFMVAVAALLFACRRRRWVYVIFAVSVSLIMVVTPLLQASGVVRFQENLAQAAPAKTLTQALGLPPNTQYAADQGSDRNTQTATGSTRTDRESRTAIHTRQSEPDLRCGDGEPGADADEDGLSDRDEYCLGTDAEHEDSDRDVLTDTLEIDGFDYGGRHWTSNPFKPDSNEDGLSDVAEWPEPVGTAPDLDVADDWDPDGDGVPNLWDEDNDGDEVPDGIDLSPFARSSYSGTFSLSTQGGDFEGYQYIEIQVQPQDPSHLRYSTGYLDWPHDEEGQIQDLDDSTDDIRLFPMLRISTNQAPNRELGRKYGVTVFEEDEGYTLYVPVSPVGEGGQMVAFYAKVAYGPDEIEDIRWDKVELVWTVQLSQDQQAGGEVVTSITTVGTQAEDSFRVSGLQITKSRNYQSAVLGTPGTPGQDRWLFNVLFGLSNTFLTHQDPDLPEVEHRFNNPNTSLEKTWGVPPQHVEVDLPANPYGHSDEGTADLSARIVNYLEDHNYPTDGNPSLILAIQEEVGLYGLDDQGQFEPEPVLDLNLNNVAMATRRSLKSNTYQHEDGEWQTMDLDETLDMVQERHEDELDDILADLEEDYPDLTEDDLKLLLDMFYTSWFVGQTRLMDLDGQLLAPEGRDDQEVRNQLDHDQDTLPAYLLEAAHLGEIGGGLAIGDNQTQMWEYQRAQEGNESGVIDPVLAGVGRGSAGIVKLTLSVRTTAQAIKFAELGGGYRGWMGIVSDNAGAGARKLGAAGAVLGVAFIWTAFGLGADFSNPLAVKQAVAYAVVATVICVAMFAISLNPIGAILMGLFSFIDLIFVIAYGGQSSLTEIVSRAIAEFFYSVNGLTTFEDVDFVDFGTEVMDQEMGIAVGNRFRVSDECVGTIERTSEGDKNDLEDSFVICGYDGSAAAATATNQNGDRDCSRSDTTLTCRDPVGVEFLLDTAQRNVELEIESWASAKTFYQECTLGGGVCWRTSQNTDLPADLPRYAQWDSMVFYLDVLPANLLDLWVWSEVGNPDPDGDDLNNDEEASLGTDPGNWDSDGDGLSDGYEYDAQEDLGTDPLLADSDGDGLNDGHEFRIGTKINAQDSDDDGLTDGEEVFHYDGGDWTGGWQVSLPDGSAWVYSDPLADDADGDGLNDKSEHNADTSPYGYDGAPRLTLEAEPLAESPGGSTAVYVDLGDSVDMVLTLDNAGPHAVTDTLTLCLPDFMGNIQGGEMQGDRTPPTQPAASCNGLQWSFAAAEHSLLPDEVVSTTVSAQVVGVGASASDEIDASLPYRIGDDTQNVVDQVTVVADLANPQVSMTAPADGTLLGGGVSNYVLGGSASDDDSWVTGVQVNLPGVGWVDAEGISPWAYTWELPSDGYYSLQAHGYDYLGHGGASSTVNVAIDNTSPVASLDLADGEVVSGESGQTITITLSGDATDNLSGLVRVQVSTDERPWQEVWAEGGAPLNVAWSKEWILPGEESAQGEHTVEVRALDRAGNESAVLKRTIIVDVVPPTSELTDRSYLNDLPPHIPVNQALDLYGVANDAGNVPLPARPVELVGQLHGLQDATIWLEVSAVVDDDKGVSVIWLGDFNGDRLGDLAVGLPGAAEGAGWIAVVYGRAGGWPVPRDTELMADSPTSFAGTGGAELGGTLGAAGDVNGDGFDDLLVGDPDHDRVFVVFGQAGSLGRDLALDGPRSPYWSVVDLTGLGDLSGLSAAGDVNGDGFGDLLVGTTGKTYLLVGEPSPWWATIDLADKAAAEIDSSGSARLAGVGDMDGDEYNEFAIGVGNTVYLFEGRESFAPMAGEALSLGDAIATFASANSYPQIAGLGDVDGDAYNLADFVYADGGSPQVIFGDVNRDWHSQALSFSPEASGFLAAPGDVDADGQADVLLGNADGDAYLVLGKNLSEVGATLTGVQTSASTPYASGADLNSDGSSDLLLVSSESGPGTVLDYGSPPHVAPGDLPLATGGTVGSSSPDRVPAGVLATTHYVNDDGVCQGNGPCYANIQAAVDAAEDGDTIKVEPGVYASFTVSDTSALTITGAYADVVFVDGGGGPFAARIQNASGVELEGMTLRNADEAVYLENAGVGGHEDTSQQIVLDTLFIHDFASHAVAMDRVSTLRLSHCTLAGGDNHFELYGTPDPAADPAWSTVSTDSRTATDARGGILTDGEQLYFLDDSAQIDVYHPLSDTWDSLPIPPQGYNAGMTADENGQLWALRGDELGGFDGPVYAIAYVDENEIYVGGDFHHAGDSALDYIARWDGRSWGAVGTGGDTPDSPVYALAVDGVELYAGGPFGLRYLPDRINPSAWQAWGEITGGGSVYAIAVDDDGDVYVGGSFDEIGGIAAHKIAKREVTGNWKLLGYSASDSCNGVMRGSHVSTLVVEGSSLYLGGNFSTAAHNPGGGGYCGTGCSTNLARLSLSDDRFHSITDCDYMLDSTESVYALEFFGSDLMVGGDITCVDMEHGPGWSDCHQDADYLAILHSSGLWSLPAPLKTNGPVKAIEIEGDSLYIGGDFTKVGSGLSAQRVARCDDFSEESGTWYDLGGLDDGTRVLVHSEGNTYVGGKFTQAGGNPAFHLARWDGSEWTGQTFFQYDGAWQARTAPAAWLGAGSAIAGDGDGILYAVPGGGSSDFFRYTVSSDTWAQRASLPAGLGSGGALAWADGYLYALRGGGSDDFYRYNPAGDTWQTLEPVTNSVAIDAGGALAWDGWNWLYVLAGGNGQQLLRYRIPDGVWEEQDDTLDAVNAGGGLARIGYNLYGVPGGGAELWSYDPIAVYPEKLVLDQVALVAPENAAAPTWINIDSVLVPPDDFAVAGADNTWVGGSGADWSPDPQLEGSAEINRDEARFVDAGHGVYRVDKGSLLDGGYHTYRPDITLDENPAHWECPGIQACMQTGANRVRLESGVFQETFTLVSGVEVVGNGAGLTILEPPLDNTDAALVRAEGVVGAQLSMMTLNGADSGVHGLSVEDGTKAVTVKNTIIRGTDTAIRSDGGSSELEVANNTIVSNNNGLVAANCAPVDVRNTIFADQAGTGLAYDGCATLQLHKYNLYWDNGTDLDPSDPGPGELFLDPLFVAPGPPSHDYHTQDGSPTIDAGDPGDPAPPGAGARVDIGYIDQNRAGLYVDDDYCEYCPNDGLSWQVDAFDTIQDALDTAEANIRDLKGASYTVGVAPGTYTETITVPSYVRLVGSSAEEVAIVADSSSSVVTFDGVVQSELSNFTVQAWANTTAIDVTGAANAITISRNIIETYNDTSTESAVAFRDRATGRVAFNTFVSHTPPRDYGTPEEHRDNGISSSGVGTWVAVENNIFSGELDSVNPAGCDSFRAGHFYGLHTLSFGQIFNDYNLLLNVIHYRDEANTGLSQGPHDLIYTGPCFEYGTYRIEPSSKARDAASPYAEVPPGGGERADMGYYELEAAPLPLFLGREDVSTALGNSGMDQVEVGFSQVADPDSPVTDTLPAAWTAVTLDSPGETVSYWQTAYTPLQNSLYRFYSRASDAIGNQEQDEEVWYDGAFVADSEPPVVTWLQPPNGANLLSPLELRAQVYDYAAGEFSVDDVTFYVDSTEYEAEWAADPWDEGSEEPRTFRAWVDLGNGTYSNVYAVAKDRTGNQGQSSPVGFTVIGQGGADSTPPVLAVVAPLDGAWFTHTVAFTGTVVDLESGVAAVEVSLDGGYTWRPATVDGTDWHLTWTAPEEQGFVSYPARVRARDQAGNTSTDARSFSIDDVPPLGPIVEEFLAVLGPFDKEAPPGTHFDLPVSLQITWRKPVDGGGYAETLIGVDQMTNTLPTLNLGPVATTTTELLITPGDWYMHLAVQDLLGNQFVRHYGPWHVGTVADLLTAFEDRVQTIVVDGELDVALAVDLALEEWHDVGWEWGIFEFMDDFEPSPELGDWWERQNLFATWDGDNLFLGWQNAWWGLDGDLWAYVGTQAGGSTQPLVPMSSSLPFEADYALNVTSPDDGSLWEWNGAAWQPSGLDWVFASGESGDTEISIPLDMAAISELQLIAFALDDEGQPWAVFPTTNPLSGDWSDGYVWENLSTTLTTTLEALIGNSLQTELDSPQAPRGVWGPGDQIEYVLSLTNRETYTLTNVAMIFDPSTGIDYQDVSGATLTDTWEFLLPDLPPGAQHLVTVTTGLAADLCEWASAEQISVSVTIPTLPPILLELEHKLDCQPPTVDLPSSQEISCWQQAIYGAASDGSGSGVYVIEFRPLGDTEWQVANGTLFWSIGVDVPISGTGQIEVRARDWYSHVSEVALTEFSMMRVTDLALAKKAMPDATAPGETITYTLAFANAGECPASDVVITDIVPVSITVTGVDYSAGVVITDTGAAPPYVWQVQDLAPGGGGIITISAVLSDTLPVGHTFTNTAIITSTTTDSDPGNNHSSAGVTVVPSQATDLALVKTVTPGTAVPGETITYTLAFTNNGEFVGRNVVISDSIPLSVTVTGVFSSGATITDTGAAPPYVWQVQDLASGEGGTITITSVLSDTLPVGHTFTNTAIITTTTTDTDPGNNHSSAGVTVVPPQAADLALVKTVTPGTAVPSETITYTLAFANNGEFVGRNVVISDSIPFSVTVTGVFSSGAAITDTGAAPPYVWQVQDLAPGEGGTITISAVLSDTLPVGHTFTNTATITSTTADSDPGNNHSSAGVTVVPSQATDLALVKTVTPGTAVPGETITYTLAFANNGEFVGRNVVISDSIPLSVTVTGVFSSGVTITDTGAAPPYVWQVQDLAPGEGGTITISAVLSDTLPVGHTFTNTAIITTTTTDANPGNNRSSAGVTVDSSATPHRVYLPVVVKNR